MTQNVEPNDLGNEPVFQKLGKSLIASCFIPKNTTLTSEHLDGKIFRPAIIPVRDSTKVIGKLATQDIKEGEPIALSMLA